MPKPEDYRNIRLDIADDGLIVEFTEIMPRESDNPVSDTFPEEHKELFSFDEAQKAVDRMMELKGVTKKQIKDSSDEDEGSDHAEETEKS